MRAFGCGESAKTGAEKMDYPTTRWFNEPLQGDLKALIDKDIYDKLLGSYYAR
jgi:hypothetical protein